MGEFDVSFCVKSSIIIQLILIVTFQVGNCVGKRNYRFFYMFIVSLAFLAVFIFSCSITHLILCKL